MQAILWGRVVTRTVWNVSSSIVLSEQYENNISYMLHWRTTIAGDNLPEDKGLFDELIWYHSFWRFEWAYLLKDR